MLDRLAELIGLADCPIAEALHRDSGARVTLAGILTEVHTHNDERRARLVDTDASIELLIAPSARSERVDEPHVGALVLVSGRIGSRALPAPTLDVDSLRVQR